MELKNKKGNSKIAAGNARRNFITNPNLPQSCKINQVVSKDFGGFRQPGPSHCYFT